MGLYIFWIWQIRKFRWVGILKWEEFFFIKFNQCAKKVIAEWPSSGFIK